MKLEDFIDKINKDEHFSFSRWGDGEWSAVLKKQGQNCDGHKYFPDMGKRLDKILKNKPKYILGLQPLAKRLFSNQIYKYNIKWINSDVFHNANIDGSITKFWDCLKNKNVLLVGPKHLNSISLTKLFTFKFYQVPSRNCWLEYDKILSDLKEIITDDTIVLFCASMTTNVLIDDLNGKGTLIDLGSVLDPYVGVKSRSYHYKLNLNV